MTNIKKTVCKVAYCNSSVFRSRGKYVGYCQAHVKQLQLYGEIRTDIVRNKNSPNRIIVEGELAKIELYDKFGNIKSYAIIDIEDIKLINKYKWSDDSKGHVLNRKNNLWLHYEILQINKVKGIVIDHIDGDGFNNRKSNLRPCSFNNNAWNIGLPSDNTSGFLGVSWCNTKKKWRAVIVTFGKYKHIGYYDNIKDAKTARMQCEMEQRDELSRIYRGANNLAKEKGMIK